MIVRYILRKTKDSERTEKKNDLTTFHNILDILQSTLEYMEDIWDVQKQELPDEPVKPVNDSFLSEDESGKFDEWLRGIYESCEDVRQLSIWKRIVVFLGEEDREVEDAVMLDQDEMVLQALRQEVGLAFRPHQGFMHE